MRRLLISALCLAGLAVPAAAGAAQPIGINQTTNASCGSSALYVSPTTDYQLPFKGVITSFAVTRGTGGGTYSVKLVRDNVGSQSVVASTGVIVGANTNTTYQTRLPGTLGDRLGMWMDASAPKLCGIDGTG